MANAIETGPASQVPALRLRGISRAFEHTQAVDSVDFEVETGSLVGVVGHNGAGKSTLMRISCGVLEADSGEVSIDGHVMPRGFTIRDAREGGLSLAMQEISLCPDLQILENVVVLYPELKTSFRRWKARAALLAAEALAAVFPTSSIDPRRRVRSLSLAERQMLQVAFAAAPFGMPAKMLILDEPTSALSEGATDELFEYLRKARDKADLGAIIISHKMRDILDNTDRTVVMKDGKITADKPSATLTLEDLVGAMSSAVGTGGSSRAGPHETDVRPAEADRGRARLAAVQGPLVQMTECSHGTLSAATLDVRRGEIVGLAGLEGSGQREVLDAVWRAGRRPTALSPNLWRQTRPVKVRGTLGVVTGDRQTRGVLPLWNVQENMSIGFLHSVSRLGLIQNSRERKTAANWIDKLKIKATAESNIMHLSGGSQQKVLLARGLAGEPDLLLLDDPFRGVDIMTKVDAYERMREETRQGRSFLWYTSENTELFECDRVYVLHSGRVVRELTRADISLEKVVSASFVPTDAVGIETQEIDE